MRKFIIRHREMLLVVLLGLIVFAALNVMMLFYHYDPWTNRRVGFWAAFYKRFEISGFDPLTYIILSKWRPLYVLSRHPLLSMMVYPLAQLNDWLKDVTGMNCAIFIVAVIWTFLSTCSWTLMYRILRRLVELPASMSLLLTAFFFSFSHILLTTFVEDHMSITLPMLLLAVYWGGKAIKNNRTMPLWQSLPLFFASTGVTTTNMVKIGIADLFTQWGRKPFSRIILHFLIYLLPLGVMLGLYFYQQETTQAEETRSNERQMMRKAAKEKWFAAEWEKQKQDIKNRKKQQLVNVSIATNTEYHIDRLPSVVENIFGEGFILHENHLLEDANKKRPAYVAYTHWWYYLIEALIVGVFVAGIWYGRKQRLLWMVMSMFLFDMLLHVGLNFASADVYIMTAHWAFVIPIAVGYMFKALSNNVRAYNVIVCLVFFLTVFMFAHNLQLIIRHILG